MQKKKGQVLIEWVLLVGVAFLIFGFVFTIVRANIFSIWVCEYWPRIASPRACADANECWEAIEQAASNSDEASRVRQTRDAYCD